MNISDDMWRAYYLCHHDHRGLSYEEAAEKMGITFWEVRGKLRAMCFFHPDLFTDISGDGRRFDHNIKRYGNWCDGMIKERF